LTHSFARTYLKETGHFVISSHHDAMALRFNFPALIVVVADIPTT